MPVWPFTPSRAEADAARLLRAVEAASRRPAFYGAGRVADTLEGRFELLALNAALALLRLRAEAEAAPLAQAFTDRFFRSIDAGLRESGVGDLSVPKKMRGLAGAFYGRLNAYAEALATSDQAGLTEAIQRNIVEADAAPFAPALAAYAVEAWRLQAAAPLEALFSGDNWPALGG
jgi:cytochrome b pre-mRNA-processing protein 3